MQGYTSIYRFQKLRLMTSSLNYAIGPHHKISKLICFSGVVVKEKDGNWRFCIDYRLFNTSTFKCKFPIPIIEELLDELWGAHIFFKLDLRSGYYQIRVVESNVHETTFNAHIGLYEFIVMSFAIMKAPATFQSLMNDIFHVSTKVCVGIFFMTYWFIVYT